MIFRLMKFSREREREVRKGKIVQARQKFNDPVSDEQQEVIDKWNTWYSKKYEEREELKDAS